MEFNIDAIIEWQIKNGIDTPGEYVDPEGARWDNVEEYIRLELLNTCGCGSLQDSELPVTIMTIMKLAHDRQDQRYKYYYKDTLTQMVTHILGEAKVPGKEEALLGHGGSVGSSILTKTGEEFMKENKIWFDNYEHYETIEELGL